MTWCYMKVSEEQKSGLGWGSGLEINLYDYYTTRVSKLRISKCAIYKIFTIGNLYLKNEQRTTLTQCANKTRRGL